jgi:phosphatidylserine decarboxylase
MLDNPDEFKTQAKIYANKAYDSVKWLLSNVPPIHSAGYPFIGIFFVVSLLLGLIWQPLFWIGLFLTLWCAYFFRDPVRMTPSREGLIVSAADGLISMIEKATLPSEFDDTDDSEYTRVSIFLNVFDVHIQRAPVDGKILETVYRPGKFLNASLDKASEDNERSSVLLQMTNGQKVAFVQIAGLIARRIINNLHKEQVVKAGERYGLIRFGSRVDIYLPGGVNPQVIVGQRVVGGETIIADLQSQEPARTGVIR